MSQIGVGVTIGQCGELADYHFKLADFTRDGNWHELDLSSIVPTGTKVVLLYISVGDNVAGSYLYLRKKGQTNIYNLSQYVTQVADKAYGHFDLLFCSSDYKLEYLAGNGDFTAINMVVKGWVVY